MKADYKMLNVNEIELDFDNPRIAKALEIYKKEELTAEQISLALGGGTNDNSGTSYATLKESIKTNGSIINPIMVNKENDRYVVIEGNTRVQIYREFLKNKVEGSWNEIPSLIYENLTEEEKDAIRLQSHLVGPREWDPYSKAKYLNLLSNKKRLPMSQIISFCGGKQNEIIKSITAYQDMEEYYRKNLEDDDEFDQREFSKFYEMEKGRVKQSFLSKGYSLDDYSKWVINGNVDTAVNVRYLPQIFESESAIKIFLDKNINEAYKSIIGEDAFSKKLVNVPYNVLAEELSRRINEMEWKEVLSLQNDPEKEKQRISLLKVFDDLKLLIESFEDEDK